MYIVTAAAGRIIDTSIDENSSLSLSKIIFLVSVVIFNNYTLVSGTQT